MPTGSKFQFANAIQKFRKTFIYQASSRWRFQRCRRCMFFSFSIAAVERGEIEELGMLFFGRLSDDKAPSLSNFRVASVDKA